MLHDLYLLSCFFEPSQAMLYAEDLERRYGAQTFKQALENSQIEFYTAPKLAVMPEPERLLCRLTRTGRQLVEVESGLAA